MRPETWTLSLCLSDCYDPYQTKDLTIGDSSSFSIEQTENRGSLRHSPERGGAKERCRRENQSVLALFPWYQLRDNTGFVSQLPFVCFTTTLLK